MKAKQLAAALRLGHEIPAEQIADELDRLVAELVGLQMVQNGMLRRIQTIPRRGVQEGYSIVRLDDAIKCVAPRAVEIEPENDDE